MQSLYVLFHVKRESYVVDAVSSRYEVWSDKSYVPDAVLYMKCSSTMSYMWYTTKSKHLFCLGTGVQRF